MSKISYIIIALIMFINLAFYYPGGSPAAYTNSPGDGKSCTSCHGGSQMTIQGTGWVTSDVPLDGYTPGTTYNMTVTVPGSGTKGFEVSPQSPSGTLLGTLIAGTNNKLTGSGKYITQSSSSNANPAVWKFKWVAPVKNTGVVTFYGSYTVSKKFTYVGVNVFPEKTQTGIYESVIRNPKSEIVIYPNPSHGSSVVSYELSEKSHVTLIINDQSGKKVKELSQGIQMAGNHKIILNTNELSSGMYYYTLKTDNTNLTGKMIISR
jgi:hypothetical protein